MKRLCTAVAAVCLSVSLPAQESTTAYFGLQTHFGQGRGDLDSLLTLVRDAGIGAIRDEVYWSDIETTPDSFRFLPSHDAYIQGAVAHGLRPLIILDYGNDLYGGTPRDSASRAAFGRYCNAVVSRYAPLGVKDYEVWNEPNLCVPGFCPWNPGPNPAEYFELLKVAYRACKEVDSTAFVVGCATSPLDEPETSQKIPGVTFIGRVFALGGGAYMDAVSFHQYPIGRIPEEWIPKETGRVQAIVGLKPLWITEIGYPTSIVSEEQQADLIARTYLMGRMVSTLQRVSWYDLIDDCADPSNAECRYGILHEDKSPKPAYRALRTVTGAIGSLAYVRSTSVSGRHTAYFGTGSSEVIALWHESSSQPLTVHGRSPSLVLVSRDGARTYFVAPDSQITVTVTPSPQYLLQSTAPQLKSFRISPEQTLLDSGQMCIFRIRATDTADATVQISNAAATWTFSGTGGTIDSSGTFHATGPGEGVVAAEYGVHKDSAAVKILASLSAFVLEDFDDVGNWSMACTNIDSSRTFLTASGDRSSHGPSSGRLDYGFAYHDSLGTSSYHVDFTREVPIPGRPDSIVIDLFGNGQPHRILYGFHDVYGQSFTRSAASQPALWDGVWRSIAIPLHSLPSGIVAPVTLQRITFFVGQNAPVNDSSYGGTIYLDHLRTVYNPVTGVGEEEVAAPRFMLKQNFPNPFNPTTRISYSVPVAAHVTLEVFSLLGQPVAKLVDEEELPGEHVADFTASGLASGVYFYRLRSGRYSEIRKLVLVR